MKKNHRSRLSALGLSVALLTPNLLHAESPPASLPASLPALRTNELEVTGTSGDRFISGVYPHLTAYSQSLISGAFSQNSLGECGIGAVIP